VSRLHGLFGRPFVDLAPLIDTACFPALDEEIALGLARVDVSQTGGSLKWMGVVAPWFEEDPYRDYGHVIGSLGSEEWRRFVSLAEDPARYDGAEPGEVRFGDETDNPLSRAQMRYLAYRHGVYFPWKVCYHLLSNDRWEDKHSGEGKSFSEEAARIFPQTVAFVRALPFREIGRCVIFGLHENDHAPAHRDTEPGQPIAQSISFSPRPGKRFYVCGDGGEPKQVVTSPIYWFNDMDWHGVEAGTTFSYSIRVDGVFERGFERSLRRLSGR
jgi:Rieske 2Fe-2S family protein